MTPMLVLFYGLVSTILSSLSNRWINELDNPLPGLLFGVSLLLVYRQIFRQTYQLWKKIVFILVSGVAYIAAMVVAYSSIDLVTGNCTSWGPCGNQYLAAYFVGGLAGGFILCLGIKLILKTINWFQLSFLILLAGILGPLGYKVDMVIKNNQTWMGFWQFWLNIWQLHQNFGLYLVWQTVMLIVLAVFMKANQKNNV